MRTGPGRPALPTGTVTFLRTDIEGSMRLVRQLGERYDALQSAHHALIRSAYEPYGGVEVGTEGDAFSSCSRARARAVRSAAAISAPWLDTTGRTASLRASGSASIPGRRAWRATTTAAST